MLYWLKMLPGLESSFSRWPVDIEVMVAIAPLYLSHCYCCCFNYIWGPFTGHCDIDEELKVDLWVDRIAADQLRFLTSNCWIREKWLGGGTTTQFLFRRAWVPHCTPLPHSDREEAELCDCVKRGKILQLHVSVYTNTDCTSWES